MSSGDGSAAPPALMALLRGARCDHSIDPHLSNQQATDVTIPDGLSTQEWAGGTTLTTVLSVMVAVGSTWIDLRTRQLRQILKSRSGRRGRGAKLDELVLGDRARAFANARRWCPIRPNCLLDSLAFDRWLGIPRDITLVFGIVGQPFEAHCWVQSDAAVLNDSYDRVSRFVPVLSV
ncbi:lasso peptide biosynthesis B2 protein [Sphingomonas suaedae]|uniref:lasso peptide biosynthesis B2 protein n=1 Tax=Sphingomonas suaedae TaxID=2599297 RepID=UPI001644AAE2|nr:lasso peptide biosynthesis B2 protein [Sphingomonas suaedae]